MRKILILSVLFTFLLGGIALGQTWHTANQVTVAWDAVTTFESGDPLPETAVIKYKVYIKNAVTGGEAVELEEVTTLEYVVTLNVEGKYFLGVKALRYCTNPEEELVSESMIAWSDVPEYCYEGETFGVRYFHPPAAPSGLKLK